MEQTTIREDRGCHAQSTGRSPVPATGPGRNLGTRKQGWIASGRNNPCPVCGRDVDDKCRRTDDLIACFIGERFAPPPGLRLGDTLPIDGRQWAVVKLGGGFAGASLILRPDLGRQDFAGHPRPPRRPRDRPDLAPALQSLLKAVRAWVHRALAVPCFENSGLVELRTARQVIATARTLLAQLLELLTDARREGQAGIDTLRTAAAIWDRQIGYLAADLDTFYRVHLGEPGPADVAALQEVAA